MPPTSCPLPAEPDFSGITIIKLQPIPSPVDYLAAMAIAKSEADNRLNEPMLLSWYDRDRDFEAPQHVSECHQKSATPGYVDYGLNHGAQLMIDVESGRFVYFYRDAFRF
jgi:Domain of unknown function (DUF5619)